MPLKVTANYHTHTTRCNHAVGEDRAYEGGRHSGSCIVEGTGIADDSGGSEWTAEKTEICRQRKDG